MPPTINACQSVTTHHFTGPEGIQGPQSSQSVPRSHHTVRGVWASSVLFTRPSSHQPLRACSSGQGKQGRSEERVNRALHMFVHTFVTCLQQWVRAAGQVGEGMEALHYLACEHHCYVPAAVGKESRAGRRRGYENAAASDLCKRLLCAGSSGQAQQGGTEERVKPPPALQMCCSAFHCSLPPHLPLFPTRPHYPCPHPSTPHCTCCGRCAWPPAPPIVFISIPSSAHTRSHLGARVSFASDLKTAPALTPSPAHTHSHLGARIEANGLERQMCLLWRVPHTCRRHAL